MVNNKRDWSEHYEMVYDIFCKNNYSKNIKPTIRGFCDFIGISLGKRQKWEAGQWPSADDLLSLHKKMGFSYAWLVAGEGEPFDTPTQQIIQHTTLAPPKPELDMQQLLARLEAIEKKVGVRGTGADEDPHVGTQVDNAALGARQDGN